MGGEDSLQVLVQLQHSYRPGVLWAVQLVLEGAVTATAAIEPAACAV